MALPTANELSDPPRPAAFRPPLNVERERLVDWSRGGRGIQDPSEGLDVLDWRARCEGRNVFIGAPGAISDVLYFELPVTPWDIAMSFDTNMNVVLGWEGEDYSAAFRWFDPVPSEFVVVPLPTGTRSVRVQFDDVRPSEFGQFGDTIISYIRGNKLYFRVLRERFQTEHELYSHPLMDYLELGQCGMNLGTPPAYQWQLKAEFSRERPTIPTQS